MGDKEQEFLNYSITSQFSEYAGGEEKTSDSDGNPVVPSPDPITKRKKRPPQRYGIINLCFSSVSDVEEIDFVEVICGPEAQQWK